MNVVIIIIIDLPTNYSAALQVRNLTFEIEIISRNESVNTFRTCYIYAHFIIILTFHRPYAGILPEDGVYLFYVRRLPIAPAIT